MFRLFENYHTEIYEYMESQEWVDDNYSALYFYKQGPCQILAKYMVYFHFGKKVLENLLLHRSAGQMTPVNRFIW